jgi:predicted DsbA family dithiol-disulfide isomerase
MKEMEDIRLRLWNDPSNPSCYVTRDRMQNLSTFSYDLRIIFDLPQPAKTEGAAVEKILYNSGLRC